jgi:hypothetical protein
MNAVEFLHQQSIRYWREFHWYTKTWSDGVELWKAEAVIRIPLLERFLPEPIWSERVLMRITLCRCQGIKTELTEETALSRQMIRKNGKYIIPLPGIRRRLQKELLAHILKSESCSVGWLEKEKRFAGFSEERWLKALDFFLCFDRLREGDFFFWRDTDETNEIFDREVTVIGALEEILGGRREKRVRRALFVSYSEAMERGFYDPTPDRVFAELIEDRNHLEALISLPTETKMRLFREMEYEEAAKLVVLLKERYGERGVVNFFQGIDPWALHANYVVDIFWTWRYLGKYPKILRLFRKVPPRVELLHRELTRMHTLIEREESMRPFSYEERCRRMERRREELELRLPVDGVELQAWGLELGNCLGSYEERIRRRRCTVFGVYRKGRLLAALELRRGKIVQCSGRFNRPLEKDMRKKIAELFLAQ